jgi:DNA-directed RNA polymerase subunit L
VTASHSRVDNRICPIRLSSTHTYIPVHYPFIGEMNIKILELEKNKARLIIQGEGHTFMNVLTEEILKDPDVDVARYLVKFQFSDPELLVTTRGNRNPLAVVREACGRLEGYCNELLEQIPAD